MLDDGELSPAAAPPAPLPAAPVRRARRLISVFSAIAAVLVVVLLTVTLLASHHTAGLHASTTPTRPTGPSAPPLSYYVSTTAQGTNQQALVALYASDGSVRWRHDTGSESIFPTFLQNGVIYASSSSGTVYAFSTKDGSLLWSFKALLHTSLAAVVNGVVYAGSDDETRTNPTGHQYSYAINASNGQLLWLFTRGENIGPVVDGIAYVESDEAQADRTLYALNASDGSVRWSTHGNLLILQRVTGGIAYETTTQIVGPNMDPYATLHALDASSGKELWSFFKSGAVLNMFIPGDGVVYLDFNEGEGGQPPDAIYAVNVQDGSVRWQVTLANGMMNGAVLNNGVLYVGASDQTVQALNADNGARLWRVQLQGAGVPEVVGEGLLALFISSYPTASPWNVAVLNASDGSMRWNYNYVSANPNQILELSALINGVLYAMAASIFPTQGDSEVLAFDASTGALKWSYTFAPPYSLFSFPPLIG